MKIKPIKELRKRDFNPHECGSYISYFKQQNIDWNVFLPTKNMNLQRDFVWTLKQKREIIYSVLLERHIPHMSFINIVDPENNTKEIWQIIDGKQRLSSFLDFIDDKFTIILEGEEYYFKDLPEDYQRAINHFYFRYYVVNEEWDKPITDQQKINWFQKINFSGTPQDEEHLEKLNT